MSVFNKKAENLDLKINKNQDSEQKQKCWMTNKILSKKILCKIHKISRIIRKILTLNNINNSSVSYPMKSW